MKKIMVIAALLICSSIIGQTNEGFVQNNPTALAAAGNNNVRSQGQASLFINPAREIDGSIHLFDNWENTAIIHTNDAQRFMLRNINLNLKRNTFESKISKDSLFTFNFNNIEKFVINNKVYKNYYWDDDNKVYQVIYDGDDFQILKGYKLEFVEGSANPMLNRARDKYIQKEYYYLREEGRIKYFNLKKGRILKLLKGQEDKARKAEAYAKNNRLSFKRELDVQKILEYSDNI